jgi:hypothetical protein
MTNQPLRAVQMQLNRFIDSRKHFWTTNAEFVGTTRYLMIGDPLKKLSAKLANLQRRHRFTPTQAQQAARIKAAIAALSRPPARSKSRRAVA